IDEFARRLDEGGSWLEPFHGFGPDSFLVGRPKFDFNKYEPFLTARFAPSKTKQLLDKMDNTTLFGIASFIQALGQNPGLEAELQLLKDQAHVYVANALGAFPTIHRTSVQLYRAQRRWNRFWSHPERNEALRLHQAGVAPLQDAPQDPEHESNADLQEEQEDAWYAFWSARSHALGDYLEEFRQIESPAVEGDVEKGKMKLMRDKRRQLAALKEKWQAPEPPWNEVSANVLWNIPNTPASQISMIGKITGLAMAPVAACSTFGIALKTGMDAIARGEAKLAVIGSVDPAPHPLTVGAFYSARVLSADGQSSKPLTGLKGTHVAGGGCIWIIGDAEYGQSKGFVPLGLQPLAVGVSSDADHIITPSQEGPRAAMRQALELAGVHADQLQSWDLHATATPGDAQELANLQSVVAKSTKVTARKGTFGHGMGVGGGWELTAQYLGAARGQLYPTALSEDELNPVLGELGQTLVYDSCVNVAPGPVGKLSMGVGGINACVISRPYDED
ncbi:MAG TPA: beta-ketoacyl synthase N-terminal-like domain-containing protein, partial [Polyangiaceae bacterium]|nr:beta-ketoacyl synthase N-terminal-like domain-containing protein [Polyangiaceae bacterium]